jgi:SAM-dependent methyltransferase
MNHFGNKAAEYSQFRPHYPAELFQYLIQLTHHQECAWDVGTGNGQAAVALSPYFNKVIATDLKQGQLDRAEKKDNISYIACPAEKTPIEDKSVDLITVAQALHWFNFDEFYQEVQRVAKPDCLVAAWCYTLISISPEIDQQINHLYSDILGDQYWPKERQYIDSAYTDIPFPFQQIKTPTFTIARSLNFSQLIGYLNTWSALQEYKTRNQNKNPLDFIIEDVQKLWGAPDKEYITHTPLYLLAGYFK